MFYCNGLPNISSCPTCGRIYNVYLQPPKVQGICDVDGALLATRPDDAEAFLRNA